MQVSHCEHVQLNTEHTPTHDQYLDAFIIIYLHCPALWLLHELSYSCNARSSTPMPTVSIILLFIKVTDVVSILLLLLFCYCFCCSTVATDKSCQASLLSGAAELTTRLLGVINILWLPLCRINKFGFYFPRRLLRSPILVGISAEWAPVLGLVESTKYCGAKEKLHT